jgi:hypothetical protein
MWIVDALNAMTRLEWIVLLGFIGVIYSISKLGDFLGDRLEVLSDIEAAVTRGFPDPDADDDPDEPFTAPPLPVSRGRRPAASGS